MTIRHLGRIQVKTAGNSAGFELQVQEVWPAQDLFDSTDALLMQFVADQDSDMLDAALESVAVTYMANNGHEMAGVVLHRTPLLPDGSYVWCPVLPESSPMGLESYLADNPVLCESSDPNDPSTPIAAISGHNLVMGLEKKKSGKAWRLAVKEHPLKLVHADTRWCIQEEGGWFVPQNLLMQRTSAGAQAAAEVAVAGPRLVPAATQRTSAFEAFLAFVDRLDLHYDVDDLALLYSGMQSGQFVVLGGPGGVGKSGLAQAVARFLDCSEEQRQLAWLTVEPSWVSTEQILGHYDYRARLYRPASTNLADVLVHAAKNADISHLVCLDELNLGRVEHYLAPFLSLKDHAEFASGWPLYSRDLEGECLNSHHYPPSVALGANVKWLGTINIDEASYALTEKFLDRILYISMRTVPFSQKVSRTIPSADDSWQPVVGTADPLSVPELEYLDQFNHAVGYPLLSWRALKAMQNTVAAVPLLAGGPIWSRAQAWDEQVAARILSKFRGASVILDVRESDKALKALLSSGPWGPLKHSLAVLEDLQREREALGDF